MEDPEAFTVASKGVQGDLKGQKLKTECDYSGVHPHGRKGGGILHSRVGGLGVLWPLTICISKRQSCSFHMG